MAARSARFGLEQQRQRQPKVQRPVERLDARLPGAGIELVLRRRRQRPQQPFAERELASSRSPHRAVQPQIGQQRVGVRRRHRQPVVLPGIHVGEGQPVDRVEGHAVGPDGSEMAAGLIEETFEGTPGIEERDATQLAGLTEHADESQVPWHLLALDGDEVFVGQPVPWLRRVEEGGGVSEGADALDRHAGRLHQAGHRIAVLVLLFEGAERVPHGGLVLDHDDPGVEGGQGRGQGIAQDGIPHFDSGRPSLELLRPLQPELQECGEGQLRRRLSACFRQSGVHQAGPQADPESRRSAAVEVRPDPRDLRPRWEIGRCRPARLHRRAGATA